jgi:kumamolisin
MLIISMMWTTVVANVATAASVATTIERNTLPVLGAAQIVGRAPRHRAMRLVVGLRLRNRAALDALTIELYDPISPNYRHFLTPSQFADQFAPDRRRYTQVARFLRQSGLEITGTYRNRMAIEASGTVEQIERTFSVSLNSYAINGQSFVANDRDPQVPVELGDVIGSIAGFDDYVELRAHSQIAPSTAANATDGLTPVGFTPQQIASAYDFASAYQNGYTGVGATLAIATARTFNAADVATFWSTFGIPAPNYSIIPVGRHSNRADPETTLDLERAGAMAFGANILVYEGADGRASTFEAVYNRIVSDDTASVVTTSWGFCEQQMPAAVLTLDNNMFAEAAAQGQAWFAASGDLGAYDCGNYSSMAVDYPASDPNVTAVGGTTLTLTTTDAISSETGWSMSGGGLSGIFTQPWFATGPRVSNPNSNGNRQVADVAFNSDPATGYPIYFNGSWSEYGGTSFAAPQWAAIFALVNGARGAAIGAGGPNLYALANGTLAQPYPAFNDITSGLNGYYQAAAGWDYVTGWGSPQAWNLVQDFM